MSSIGQSILMALAVTFNKFASSNVQSVQRNHNQAAATATATASGGGGSNKPTATTISPSASVSAIGRRGLLLSTVGAAAPEVIDSRTELFKRYLKKSEENKEKNDKERLESYYKRNYKDYFEFVEGSLRNKKELSQSEKGILDWLQKNK